MTLTADPWEYAAQQFEPSRWETPGELAKAIDPHTIQTPALELIDHALVDIEVGRNDRLIISMPPQEGKSTRVTKATPLWMLTRNPERRIAIVSYGADLAQEFGRDIRQMITDNQGEDDTLDLGLRIAPDNGAVSSWKLAGHRGGVRAIGLAGGITGRPADALFIDDPISNREQANSKVFRGRAKNFWTSAGSTRLAPGAPVVLVLTRWHDDDLAGWLLEREDKDRWHVINIPAQADHKPENDETDILGRRPGQYMQSARINAKTGKQRSPAEWEQIKVQSGSRDWAALYQGKPSPIDGDILKRGWWKYYDLPLYVKRNDGSCMVTQFDDLIQSWDLTFKDTKSSDFVVGQVWMRRGANAYLLDQVRGRMSFVDSCAALRELTAKWPQAILKIVEDKANGPAVMSALANTVNGIIPEEPQGSKEARAYAISPLVEAGNVWLPAPELAAFTGGLVEEAATFPNSSNDDQVDALTQALNRLILQPLLAGGDILDEDDIDDELDNYQISQY